MIRGLGDAGVTVLLSSHILAEVQQVCTSATIIGNGRTLASGTVDELLGASTTHRVVAPDPAAARAALEAAGLPVDRRGPGSAVVETDQPGEITRALGEAGVWLTELTPGPRRPGVDLPLAHRGRPARQRRGRP